jgi:hypothetical protein
MHVTLPKYCAEVEGFDPKTIRARFMIRLAALYYSPSGQLSDMSKALGFHSGTLAGLNEISPKLAIGIEELLGRERFPRELLRPDLFLVTEA